MSDINVNGSSVSMTRAEFNKELDALRNERKSLDRSISRRDIAYKTAGLVAAVGLFPLAISGCTQPNNDVIPVDCDTEESLPPKQPEINNPVAEDGSVYASRLNIRAGIIGKPQDTDPLLPVLAVGYISPEGSFRVFRNQDGLNLIQIGPKNFNEENLETTAFGSYTSNDTVLDKADVSGKSMAVMQVSEDSRLYLDEYITFPRIFSKKSAPNPATLTDLNSPDNPLYWLEGDGADHFELTATAIQAPYYYTPDYQWRVYVYADKDILSQIQGPAAGKVLDPYVSTMTWTSWPEQGTPQNMWLQKFSNDSAPIMFNSMPIISGGDMQQKRDFLTGTSASSYPETADGMPAISNGTPGTIPNDALIYYNADRNIDLPNGLPISGRSQAGLVYASPEGPSCRRSEIKNILFQVTNNGNYDLQTGEMSCDINLYHQIAE